VTAAEIPVMGATVMAVVSAMAATSVVVGAMAAAAAVVGVMAAAESPEEAMKSDTRLLRLKLHRG